jgi:hypothetical protein
VNGTVLLLSDVDGLVNNLNQSLLADRRHHVVNSPVFVNLLPCFVRSLMLPDVNVRLMVN